MPNHDKKSNTIIAINPEYLHYLRILNNLSLNELSWYIYLNEYEENGHIPLPIFLELSSIYDCSPLTFLLDGTPPLQGLIEWCYQHIPITLPLLHDIILKYLKYKIIEYNPLT